MDFVEALLIWIASCCPFFIPLIIAVGSYGFYNHAAKHTDGTDDIQNATSGQKGLLTPTRQVLDIFEALSDESWNQQFNNLLLNWDFSSWSKGAAAEPDGWTFVGAGAAIAREATKVLFGKYSVKITRNGSNTALYIDPITPINANTNTYWRGQTISYGCWVWASVADRASIRIEDGVGTTYSAYHPGGSAWHFLPATRTLHGAATQIRFVLGVDTGDTNAYFDGVMLTEGTICPTSAPKSVEHVAGWQAWVPTLTGGADLSGYTIARFYRMGKVCFFYFNADNKNVTTAGSVQITLPYTVANTGDHSFSIQIHDGAAWVGTTHAWIRANTNYLEVYKTVTAGNWAGTEVGVYIRASGFYEIA